MNADYQRCVKPSRSASGRPPLNGLIWIALLLFGSGGLTFADEPPGLEVGQRPPVLSTAAYKAPFEDYDAWLAFMDKIPDPAWRASAAKLVDPSAFDRFKSQSSVVTKRLVYMSDGLKINGFLLAPQSIDQPLPVVIFAHGGVAEWGRITFFDLLEMHRLAERGYIVLASALRGEGGSEGTPNLGRGDRADVLKLVEVAKHVDGADLSRLGYWGFSRGGSLGYRVLAATDQFDAAVLIGAPSDLVNSARRSEFHEHVYPGVVDGYAADADEALRSLSATYWPEELSEKTRVLLIHGASDIRVPVGDSLAMASHLSRLGRTFRLVVPEDGSHSLIEHQADVRREMDRWLDLHLKAQ